MAETELDYTHYFWQGDKVRLRAFTRQDAGRRLAEALDSESRQDFNIIVELPTTHDAQEAFLDKYGGCQQVNNMIAFAVENLAGEYAGALTMHSIDERHGKFSFGILINRRYRRRGYAVDAVRIILAYGFRERRMQKCDSACDSNNAASIRLHHKLGFVEEGRRRRQWFHNGAYSDDLLFGITLQEYDALVATQNEPDGAP